EDGIRDFHVTGVQTCALPILTKRCELLFLYLAHLTTRIKDNHPRARHFEKTIRHSTSRIARSCHQNYNFTSLLLREMTKLSGHEIGRVACRARARLTGVRVTW